MINNTIKKNLKKLVLVMIYLIIAMVVLRVSYFLIRLNESIGEPVETVEINGEQAIQENYGTLVLTSFGYHNFVRGDYVMFKRGFKVESQMLCPEDNRFCIEDTHIHVSETSGDVLQVNTYPLNNNYLFDKKSGRQLSCDNCESSNQFEQILSSSFHWSSDSSQAVVANSSDWVNKQYGKPYPIPGGDKDYNAKQYNIWLLDILPNGVKVTDIEPRPKGYKFGEPLGVNYSPDYKFIAWHLCDPQCNLWRYEISTQLYTSVSYPCTSKHYNNRWIIVWESNQPKTEYDWGTQDREKCFKEDGNPVFPNQEREW